MCVIIITIVFNYFSLYVSTYIVKIIIMSVSMETLATAISLARLLTLSTGSSSHFLPKMLINFMKMKAIFTPKK